MSLEIRPAWLVRQENGTIAEARARVLELYDEQARIWSHGLCPSLAAESVVVSGVEDLGHA